MLTSFQNRLIAGYFPKAVNNLAAVERLCAHIVASRRAATTSALRNMSLCTDKGVHARHTHT